MAGSSEAVLESGWSGHAGGVAEQRMILVVEEVSGSAVELCRDLEAVGYTCTRLLDEGRLRTTIGQRCPDLIILDRAGSASRCRTLVPSLKQDTATADVPIIVVLRNGDTTEELIAFALGADDCVSQPVFGRILVTRVAALLRRIHGSRSNRHKISVGPLRVELEACRAEVDGAPVGLTPTEFRLLWSVAANGDRVTRRDDLLRNIFGTSKRGDRRIDVHMASLRKKLGPAGAWVQTIWGVGYACRPPRSSEPSTAQGPLSHS